MAKARRIDDELTNSGKEVPHVAECLAPMLLNASDSCGGERREVSLGGSPGRLSRPTPCGGGVDYCLHVCVHGGELLHVRMVGARLASEGDQPTQWTTQLRRVWRIGETA
ncbi:MAG: hypothetical protein H6716_24510 [Polyangiaceae bacterium]|nr:hypothetical protein [Polyangiaceae bacterium]MCB9629738.1 hypothetical protein [Sandaracinaceae bacterium]